MTKQNLLFFILLFVSLLGEEIGVKIAWETILHKMLYINNQQRFTYVNSDSYKIFHRDIYCVNKCTAVM